MRTGIRFVGRVASLLRLSQLILIRHPLPGTHFLHQPAAKAGRDRTIPGMVHGESVQGQTAVPHRAVKKVTHPPGAVDLHR